MTNASRQKIDNTLLARFTPLCNLDADTLSRLTRHAAIESVASGSFLFERGDSTPRTYYLLEGEIELCSPLFPKQMVSANTESGCYPLAHSIPRQFTAVTASDVRVLILPLDISELMHGDTVSSKPAPSGAQGASWESRWLESPLLRRLKPPHKKALLASMEEITAQAGQVIIHQDETADSYYVIKKGRCSVSRKPSRGARDVKLAELTEGQGFGEEALITNVPRNASVTMLEDGILLRLGKQDFIETLATPLLHHLPFQQAIELVEQGAVLIDVRTAEEFEIDGLVGSMNMPIPVLRLKANRLNRNRAYIVYSNTGQSSSVAVFLLMQQGLNAYVLEGGLNTAPRHRMKRGGFGDQGHGEQTGNVPSNNTVLPFPNNSAQKQHEVDWNNVSDDVLWRTTLGYREDAGVESAMAAKPSRAAPQTGDNTAQGFDDVHLFTPINSLQNVKLAIGDVRQGGSSGAGQGDNYRPHSDNASNNRARNPEAPYSHHQTPQWDNRASSNPWRQSIFAVLAMLVLISGGLGLYYFSRGELPDKLEAAAPMLLEQQTKLDDKVNRLLDAIESMPAIQQRRSNDAKSTPSVPAERSPAPGSNKNTPAAGNLPKTDMPRQ